MENENQNTPTQPAPEEVQPVATPAPVEAQAATPTKASFLDFFNKFKKKPESTVAQVETTVEESVAPPPVSKPKLPKKFIMIAVAIVILLVLLLLTASVVIKNNGGNIIPLASPSPSPTATPIVEVPSQYADDEDIAEVQRLMEELNKELNEAAFREDRLRIPSLDWNVEFED